MGCNPCGGSPPAAPDLGPTAEASKYAADKSYEIAMQNLQWAREQNASNEALIKPILDLQAKISSENFKNAQEDRARYEQAYLPFEKQLRTEAQSYADGSRIKFERGRAMADMQAAQEAARNNATKNLESFGIDPSQTRYAAIDRAARIQGAAGTAAAGTNAAVQAENTGRALRADVINIGRGMPSNVAQSYGTSINAGNSAVGNALNATNTGANALQGAATYMNSAQQGYGNSANIMSQGYQNRLAGWQAGASQQGQMFGALGGLAGMALSAGTTGGGSVLGHVLGFEEGGKVPKNAIPGPHDTVPAMLAPGEYVVPAEVVKAKGTEFFDRLTEKHAPHKAPKRAIPNR